MIGKTNCKAAQEQPCEKVNINIQSDSVSFPGATFTVSYGSYSKTYTWDGSVMTIDIPAYVEYTISFGAVANFTAPASITNTAKAGNSRTVDTTYTLAVEKLTVKVSGITSGYTITVVNATTGATIGTQTTASKTYSIPSGTKYYVKGSGVNGYMSPNNSSTYEAIAGGIRTVTMKYVAHSGTTNPTNGVYIQDTDGFFHTEAEWGGSYIANGVAVITENCRFVMALEDAYDSNCQWSSSDTEVTGINATSLSNAQNDYDGEDHTDAIIEQLGYSPYLAAPAYYCRAYTFPNGKKGYLGAAGEWQVALNNKSAIKSALEKCGGTLMNHLYWTSTQGGSPNALYMHWGGEFINFTTKDSYNFVRAFCSI